MNMQAYGNPVFGTVKESYPVVVTTHGKIVGENRTGVAIFRGIPYGGSCYGERRFLPPLPAPDWDGVRDCTRNGPIAVQLGESIAGCEAFGKYFSAGQPEKFGVQYETQSEDCLVLNVVTPGIDKAKRPVVVYTHGGGFSTNSGTTTIGSDRFVREEDLVVVGVNHRLNVFGYLYLGAFDKKYESSGLAGMLDLVLALKWVRDNIAYFGGDPNQVTIMGESGGGMKVSTLMAMPEAKGLFCRAIVESGSNAVAKLSRQEATAMARQLLDTLNLKENEIHKLLELPAEVILKASEACGQDMGFIPVADDIHLFYSEDDGMEVHSCSSDVPLMVGASEDEMAAFMVEESLDVTWENLRERLLKQSNIKKGPAAGLAITEDTVDILIETFKGLNLKNDDAGHLFLRMVSQGSFLANGAFRQAMRKAQAHKADVFYYICKYDAPHNYLPGKRFAWHTFDLPLQFRIVLYDEMEQLSLKMSKMWAAFIRTGNPSIEDMEWPCFTEEERLTMVFDDVCRVEADPWRIERELFEK